MEQLLLSCGILMLTATKEGEKIVIAMKAVVADVQGQIMEPLSKTEAEQMTSLLAKLVADHDGRKMNDAST